MNDTNNDQHAGMGGSYLLNAKTGVRTLIERTEGPNRAPEPDPAPSQQPAPEPVVKQNTASYPPQ